MGEEETPFEISFPGPWDKYRNYLESDYEEEQQTLKQAFLKDVENHIKIMHIKMKQILKVNEWTVYEGLYIDHLEEDQVAAKLGLKSNEKNRKPGYKQIKNIKKNIIKKAKECIEKGEIELL